MSTRLEKLKDLEARLYSTMGRCLSSELAGLAKQYRETIREIEEIEGSVKEPDDEISKILAQRAAAGKPGAVRKNRA